MVRVALELEITIPPGEEDASTEVRSLLLAAAVDSEERPEDLPAPTETDGEQWQFVQECIEDCILWDCDYAMGDEFLDQPPEASQELHLLAGVHEDYFTAIPRDPDVAGLVAVRQTLARLLDRPVPDDRGLYPTLQDLYHDLFIGPCTREEIEASAKQPWIEVFALGAPEWDCDHATWVAEFRERVPTVPFTLQAAAESGQAPESAAWPEHLRVEQLGADWVIRNDEENFWCDAVNNGWSPDGAHRPILTFTSRREAEAAYRQASKMWGERVTRHRAAIARLDQLERDAEAAG
jgi:hypothetical protein